MKEKASIHYRFEIPETPAPGEVSALIDTITNKCGNGINMAGSLKRNSQKLDVMLEMDADMLDEFDQLLADNGLSYSIAERNSLLSSKELGEEPEEPEEQEESEEKILEEQ